jgi:hypothetical protein
MASRQNPLRARVHEAGSPQQRGDVAGEDFCVRSSAQLQASAFSRRENNSKDFVVAFVRQVKWNIQKECAKNDWSFALESDNPVYFHETMHHRPICLLCGSRLRAALCGGGTKRFHCRECR